MQVGGQTQGQWGPRRTVSRQPGLIRGVGSCDRPQLDKVR